MSFGTGNLSLKSAFNKARAEDDDPDDDDDDDDDDIVVSKQQNATDKREVEAVSGPVNGVAELLRRLITDGAIEPRGSRDKVTVKPVSYTALPKISALITDATCDDLSQYYSRAGPVIYGVLEVNPIQKVSSTALKTIRDMFRDHVIDIIVDIELGSLAVLLVTPKQFNSPEQRTLREHATNSTTLSSRRQQQILEHGGSALLAYDETLYQDRFSKYAVKNFSWIPVEISETPVLQNAIETCILMILNSRETMPIVSVEFLDSSKYSATLRFNGIVRMDYSFLDRLYKVISRLQNARPTAAQPSLSCSVLCCIFWQSEQVHGVDVSFTVSMTQTPARMNKLKSPSFSHSGDTKRLKK